MPTDPAQPRKRRCKPLTAKVLRGLTHMEALMSTEIQDDPTGWREQQSDYDAACAWLDDQRMKRRKP